MTPGERWMAWLEGWRPYRTPCHNCGTLGVIARLPCELYGAVPSLIAEWIRMGIDVSYPIPWRAARMEREELARDEAVCEQGGMR